MILHLIELGSINRRVPYLQKVTQMSVRDSEID